MILAGLEVDRLLDPLPVRPVQAVEAALALASGVTGLDQPPDQRPLAVDLVERIVGRQRGAQARGDVRQQIDPDQIGQPEDAGLGDAERAAEHRIGLLDGHAHLERGGECRLHPVAADAIRDESGRVLAPDHALAEAAVGEVG